MLDCDQVINANVLTRVEVVMPGLWFVSCQAK